MIDDLPSPSAREPRSANSLRSADDPTAALPPAEPRSWLNRAADEVAAWLGDPDAAGRRQRDRSVGDHSGLGPGGHIDTDARIREELNQRLTFDPYIDARNVEAEARAGAVTLKGAVATSAERRRAEDLAIATPGVNQVTNQLVIE